MPLAPDLQNTSRARMTRRPPAAECRELPALQRSNGPHSIRHDRKQDTPSGITANTTTTQKETCDSQTNSPHANDVLVTQSNATPGTWFIGGALIFMWDKKISFSNGGGLHQQLFLGVRLFCSLFSGMYKKGFITYFFIRFLFRQCLI